MNGRTRIVRQQQRQHSHPSQSVLPSPSTPARGRADGACSRPPESGRWRQGPTKAPLEAQSHRAAQPCGDTTLNFFWRPCVVHRNSFPWQMRRNHSFPHIICAWPASFCSSLAWQSCFWQATRATLCFGLRKALEAWQGSVNNPCLAGRFVACHECLEALALNHSPGPPNVGRSGR